MGHKNNHIIVRFYPHRADDIVCFIDKGPAIACCLQPISAELSPVLLLSRGGRDSTQGLHQLLQLGLISSKILLHGIISFPVIVAQRLPVGNVRLESFFYPTKLIEYLHLSVARLSRLWYDITKDTHIIQK